MVKPELGTKRTCPETGRKFYDLNKDPIVSPYTGASYPRSYFDSGPIAAIEEEEEIEAKEVDSEEAAAEFVSLEEADDEAKGGSDDVDIGDDDVDLGDDDDDTFLEPEEEEDDDVADIINVGDEGDDEI